MSFHVSPESSERYTPPWNCRYSVEGSSGARCMLWTHRSTASPRASSGRYRGTIPETPRRHDSPPSSESHTPAAEMPTASRDGSPGHVQIECRHIPPNPGCHFGREGSFHRPSLIRHVRPPSSLLNNAAGATPIHRTSSSTPTRTIQIRSAGLSASSGRAMPSAASQPSASGSSEKYSLGP